MKKICMSLMIILLLLVLLSGCTSKKSYTFSVENGDMVKIELDTSDGYDLSSDLPFTISKDGNTLSQGDFIKIEYYDYYVNLVNNDSLSTIIDSGSDNNIEYVFYNYNNMEFNYVIKVKNSNTGILLGNPNSQKEAKECFDLLTFTLEK